MLLRLGDAGVLQSAPADRGGTQVLGLLPVRVKQRLFLRRGQPQASTTPDGALEITTTCAPLNISNSTDPDAALHAQVSNEIDNQWDGLLSPYAPFGLTWEDCTTRSESRPPPGTSPAD